MADAFRGLTIRLGADARPLNSAINSVKSSASQAQKQLSAMSKALKFDSGNIAAMQSRLQLTGDKAMLAARGAQEIRTAMSQASEATRKLAAGTTNVYSEVNRLRSGLKHADASLEHIYDGVIRLFQSAKYGMNESDAKEYFRMLRDGGKEAREELRGYVEEAAKTNNVGKAFGYTKKQAAEMIQTYDKLIDSHNEYTAKLKSAKEAEGFRAMKTQLIAWNSEIRQAASETAQFKAELFAIAGAPGLAKAVADARSLDEAFDQASAAADKMRQVYASSSGSYDVAKSYVKTLMNEQDALKQKLEATRNTMNAIEKSSGFEKQAALTKNVWVEAEKAKQEYANVETKITKVKAALESMNKTMEAHDTGDSRLSGEEYDKLKHKIEGAENALEKLGRAQAEAESKIKSSQADKEYREADIEVKKLTSDVEALGAAINGTANRTSRMGEMFGKLRTMGYGLSTTITPALMQVGRFSIQSAEDIDSAYRNMRKTVQGTEQEFEALKQAAIDYSLTHVTTAEQMLEIEAIGGQLGITVDQLGNYAKVVSDLSIATDDAFDTESVALWLGKMQNVMHIANEDIDNFADSLVRLGNSEPALESDIANITSRFASMGTTVGMLPDQILAFATAATATGQKAESSGGSLMRILGRVEVAASGLSQAMIDMANESEDSAETLAAFEEGEAALEGICKVTHMTAEEFTNLWNTDKTGARDGLRAIIQGLKDIEAEGGSAMDAIKNDLNIGSIRDQQLLLGLMQTLDVLDESLGMSENAFKGLPDAFGAAGDAAREAEKKSEGFSGQMAKMRNQATALGNELAEGAVPFISMATTALGGLTTGFRTLPGEVKSAMTAVGGIAAAAGPLLIFTGAVGSAATSIKEIVGSTKDTKLLALVAEELGVAADSIDDIGIKSKRAEGETSKLKNALNKIGGVGAIGVYAGIAAEAGMLAYALYDGYQRSEMYRQSTDGLVKSLEHLDQVSSATAASLSGVSITKWEDSVMGHDYAAALDETSRALSTLAGNTTRMFTEINDSGALASNYIKTIEELQDGYKGTTQDVTRLQAAIDAFNELTGFGLEITDLETGALNMSSDALRQNTDAWIENARAKASQELLAEGIKNQIDLETKLGVAEKRRREAKAAYDETEGMSPEMRQDALDELRASEEEVARLREQLDATDEYVEEMTDRQLDYEEAAKVAAQSTDDFRAALEELYGDSSSLDTMAGDLGISVDDLAAKMSSAGISARDFAKVSNESFEVLYQSCEQNMDKVKVGLDAINMFGLDPKEFVINDDMVVEVQGHLVDLNNQTIDGKHFTVSDDGTILVEGEAIDFLRGNIENVPEEWTTSFETQDGATKVAERVKGKIEEVPELKTTTISAYDDATSTLDGILSRLTRIAMGAVANVSVNLVANALRASGGFTKLHAAGGFITNGPISLGRDRYGITHIAGEAGREWIQKHADGTTSIVPIQNRKYLRPYAATIADMIGGNGTVNNYNITLDYKAGDDANKIVRDLGFALRTSAMMEG